MSKGISQFSKFILKKIIRGVAVCDSPDLAPGNIYKFLKVEINDDIIREIEAEGENYNLSPSQCLAEIGQADKKVNINPSLTRILSTVRMKDFITGERLDLVFQNELVGKVTLSVLVTEQKSFLVLYSDIADVQYRDIIQPLHKCLNCGNRAYFNLYRGKKVMTVNGYQLSPGVLEYIERHRPGLVFSILDTDRTFACTNRTGNEGKTNLRLADGEYPASFPYSIATPAWTVGKLEVMRTEEAADSAPFLIKIIDKHNAQLFVNPAFRFNKAKRIRVYESNQFNSLCEIDGVIAADSLLTTKNPGTLIYNQGDSTWVIVKKPELICRPMPQEALFNLIAETIRPKINRDITVGDMDRKISQLGVSTPDLLEIILELENKGKVKFPSESHEQVTSIRDLYELMLNSKKKKNGK